MSADRSDDADEPPAEHSDHPADQADVPADDSNQPGRAPAETRSREECYTALRATTESDERTKPAGRSEPGARSKPAEPTGNEQQAAAELSREQKAEKPPAEHSDRSADGADAPADDGKRLGRPQAETRIRDERDTDPRADTKLGERTELVGRSEPGAHSKPAEPTENGHQAQAGQTWEEKADLARRIWGEYKRKWPDEERPPVDRSNDPPGSWRGDSGRSLSSADNQAVEEECNHIADREREIVSPRLRKVESCDPDRQLVGFDHRLKGHDRIKEKVAKSMAEKGLTAEEAISRVPDTIRFTLQYTRSSYTQGVWADHARMEEQGFKLEIRRNSWSDDQYKGINSQWIEPRTGQRFELQFHTRISYEAKEITHKAYERLRTKQADASEESVALEELVLEAFQKKVTAEIPIPYGATDIPDYP